jgi:[ribosomal protein S18]-alanine N-acetyltransferase
VEYRLRESQRDDFDTLWKIDQQCFPPGIAYSRMELAFYMRRKNAFTLLAESTDPIPGRRARDPLPVAGFLVAEAGKRGLGHLITIDVIPAARRSGVGSTLLSAAEARLGAQQCNSLYLETAVDNVGAFTFYKRHGYVLIKTIPRYYSTGVDAFVLCKQLHSSGSGD